MSDDRTITEEKVRREHLREVDERTQWLYLAAVLGLSLLAMMGLIALLGSSA